MPEISFGLCRGRLPRKVLAYIFPYSLACLFLYPSTDGFCYDIGYRRWFDVVSVAGNSNEIKNAFQSLEIGDEGDNFRNEWLGHAFAQADTVERLALGYQEDRVLTV